MKKLLYLIICVYFINPNLKSQTSDYISLTSFIQSGLKEKITDKIIVVNFWSINDKSSRDANLDLNSTVSIFKDAKLKGGFKGVIGITICMDNDEVGAGITLKKDGVNSLINVNSSELSLVSFIKSKSASKNIAYDSNGLVVFENIQNVTFLNSIRNLITR